MTNEREAVARAISSKMEAMFHPSMAAKIGEELADAALAAMGEREVREAHDALWRALSEIIECPGASQNKTVRKMAAIAEKAMIQDTVSDVQPVPRFYTKETTR